MSLIDINLQCQRVRVCRGDPGVVLAAFYVVNRSFARLLPSFQVVAVSLTPFKESNPEPLWAVTAMVGQYPTIERCVPLTLFMECFGSAPSQRRHLVHLTWSELWGAFFCEWVEARLAASSRCAVLFVDETTLLVLRWSLSVYLKGSWVVVTGSLLQPRRVSSGLVSAAKWNHCNGCCCNGWPVPW